MNLFAMAFIQVFLISINTYFISRLNYAGIAIASFFISLVWMTNVNTISKKKSIYYPLGAMIGCLCGVYVGRLLC